MTPTEARCSSGKLNILWKTTGRYVTISNCQSARRALWASSPQLIWAVAAGNRILRQRCWHKKSRKCISLQDHVNLYQDIKILTSYCSIIGKPISRQGNFNLSRLVGTALGIYVLRVLQFKRCGRHGQRAVLALDCCPDWTQVHKNPPNCVRVSWWLSAIPATVPCNAWCQHCPGHTYTKMP